VGEKEDYTKGVEVHATTHEGDGEDAISVEGLSGRLADLQNAGLIKGVPVDDSDIGDQKVLTYDLATETIIFAAPAAG